MKFLVLAACLSVSAVQGFLGLVGHPNGAVVPVDEPAVAAARAAHLSTKGAIYSAPLHVSSPAVGVYAAGYPAHTYASGYGYHGPLNLNTHLVAHPNGAVVPADEPAVVAARADHLASKGAFYAAGTPIISGHAIGAYGYPAHSYASGYGYSGPLNLNTHLVAHPNGAVVPADEPAVVAARADHLAARGAFYGAGHAVGAYGYPAHSYASGYGYSGPLNLNSHLVAHPNGAVVPADEPAVVAARADHLAARGASYAAAAPIIAAPIAAAAPVAVASPVIGGYATGYGYGGPLNLNTHLVAHPNGAVVPADEPAVVAARADHLAARGGIY